jgi:hypothetical protein
MSGGISLMAINFGLGLTVKNQQFMEAVHSFAKNKI